MEQTVPLNFVTWLAGFVIALLTGCWAIFKYFDFKLNRVYERMDENKKEYYKEFILKEVYDAEMKARKEIIDTRFEQVVLLFNEKIESLRNEIRALIIQRNKP